jgi:hypothetical protein
MLLRVLGLLLLIAGPALAQPTVDGSLAGDPYEPASAVQAVQTNFGDNLSELDAAYCYGDGIRFYLFVAGNLEDNYNKIEIFIDSRPGGENVFSGVPGNDGAGAMAGMGFDAGFDADYHLIARHGGAGFDLDFAELGTANYSSYLNVFGGPQEGSGATGTGLNAQPIGVGFDNSNLGGVLGGTGAANQANAQAVTTGLELSIDLADIGYAGGDIRVCAFVNNGDHNFASNQFLGPLTPPQDNLGGDGAGTFTGFITFNLSDFSGDQFFVFPMRAVPVEKSSWGRIKSSY